MNNTATDPKAIAIGHLSSAARKESMARLCMPIYDCSTPAHDLKSCWFSLHASSAMPSTKTTRLFGYQWSELFDLVLDVKSYPEFVPHCRAVKMLSRKVQEPGRTIIVSRMTVGFLTFQIDYANRTTGDEIAHRINVEAIDGPMRYLRVGWNFEAVDEDHTQLHFSVDYEFNNPVLEAVASRVFNAMFGEILNAFERRAARLFPNRAAAAAARGRLGRLVQ